MQVVMRLNVCPEISVLRYVVTVSADYSLNFRDNIPHITRKIKCSVYMLELLCHGNLIMYPWHIFWRRNSIWIKEEMHFSLVVQLVWSCATSWDSGKMAHFCCLWVHVPVIHFKGPFIPFHCFSLYLESSSLI